MIRATCITLALALAIPWNTPAYAQDSSEADWLRNPAMGNYKGYAEFKMGHYAAARLARLAQPDAPASPLEQAERLASQGRHAEALALYRQAADAGQVRALTKLAWCHEAGRGTPADLATAARLFGEAARAGDAEAQYALAVMYRTGKGQPQDRAQSLDWLRKAAAQGYPPARAALAAEVEQGGDAL